MNGLKRLLILSLFSVTALNPLLAEEDVAIDLRELRKQAETLIQAGEDWASAEEWIEQILAVSNAADEVDLDAANLVRAHAEAQQGKWQESLETMSGVESFDDKELRAQRNMLHGRSRLSRAEQHAEREEWEDAVKHTVDAIQNFSEVLRENPDPLAAKHNLETALNRLRLYKREQQQQQQQDQQNEEQEQEQNEEKQEQEKSESQDGQNEQQQQPDQQENQQENEQERNQQEDEANSDPQEQQEQNQDSDDQQAGQQAGEPQEREMSEEEAKQLLNALREQEEHQRRQRKEKLRLKVIPVERDW